MSESTTPVRGQLRTIHGGRWPKLRPARDQTGLPHGAPDQGVVGVGEGLGVAFGDGVGVGWVPPEQL
jgi:hypothetical protein